MILGTVVTLGGLAYSIFYWVYHYGELRQYRSREWYFLALAIYDAAAVAALATHHPCYQFADVGITAFLVNLVFASFSCENPKDYQFVLRASLALASVALFSNIANCANGCCR
jgi:hypothetical protein